MANSRLAENVTSSSQPPHPEWRARLDKMLEINDRLADDLAAVTATSAKPEVVATKKPSRPPYEDWRARGCCNSSSEYSAFTSLLANASLSAYLYPSQAHASLAVATVHTAGRAKSAGCGILKWCFSAAAFAQSTFFPKGAVDVVVLTNNQSWARDECRTPGVRMVQADASLDQLVRLWGEQQPWPGSSKKRSRPPRPVTLMKWQLLALTEYRAIFYHDVDVDLFLNTHGRPPCLTH